MPQASTKATEKRAPVLIDLALQGGGAHGAFTWGVLDRLLEEPWLRIEAISGTSAGAMNAAVARRRVDAKAGHQGARAALDTLLEERRTGRYVQPFAAHAPRPSARPLVAGLPRPFFIGFDLMSRHFLPYDLNPRGLQSAGVHPRREH